MCTCMRTQEAEWQPTTIYILWRSRHETTHIMTPEREAAQSETQATTQIAQHTRIRRSRIAAPVQGVTLRTSPCGARPDDALARMRALYHFPKGLVIAQRIEIVLIQSTLAAIIEAIVRRCLTKVALDRRDPLFHQAFNLRLIPRNSLWIREVENGILVRHAACGIHHVQAFLDNLWEETVLRREVRQLPQTGVETVFRELLQHAYRILETILRKLIVALPIDTKPSRIEVDDVRRNLMCSELLGDVETFLL